MGFLDNDEQTGSSGSSDKLDLVEFESRLVQKFNDTGILNTKYKAEEFGIGFDKRKKESDVYYYENDETIVICPEPLDFIKEFNDVSDDTSKANELFCEKIAKFQRMKLEKKPILKAGSTYGDRMWMNKTSTGINLRPGNLNDDRDNFSPIRMCDDNVHGLIAGRTGSGKSVYINALILSLITEYAPWELNLYLADFKKVELSRYMNDSDERNKKTAFTPHVNACAATSEIRYVTSLIKYLVNCMNARQELFARLGVTKIQEFRNKYNIVLPRVLLIVDEFQQLFTEATNREKEEIQTMLNSITKLGRATGFHLIFASQEMSGTLRGNTLANFKIRMALPCNQQISADILGNSQAVNLDRGFVLVNTDSGDEIKNKKYRVPFIETDKKDEDDDNENKTPFYEYLDEIKLASKLFDLNYKVSSQKFYREELQETEIAYKEDLDRISSGKNELVSNSKSIFDAVILGKTVLYSPKPNDKVSFYVEKGRNKGLMIASSNPDDAARIRKLLTENLFRSNSETYHFGLELNNLALEKYRIDEAIKKYPIHRYYNCEVDKALGFFQMVFFLRQSASKIMDSSEETINNVGNAEKKLINLLNDSSKSEEYERYKLKTETLEKEINSFSNKIAESSELTKKKLNNPVVKFLEKCSTDIILIPVDETKVDIISLKSYKDVISNYAVDLDVANATKKSIELLDKKIEELSKKSIDNEKEKIQNDLAIKRNKIFRRALLFYLDRYNYVNPENTSLSSILENIYTVVKPSVSVYKNDCESKKTASDNNAKLIEEKEQRQAELAELQIYPNEIAVAEEEVVRLVNNFIKKIFDDAYTSIGYKKNKLETPIAYYKVEADQLRWKLKEEIVDEKLELCGNDILNTYMSVCRGVKFSSNIFKKTVFWINGLDEIEKIPNQLVEVIRNAINQNILIVAIITSELKDTTIRKAFDYAFVTGNIEKFYSMFNIKYTKQPLDSIVVNFGIRSKGFDIPFKLYKSNLEDVQAPNFIDQLLNG